jgi:membrane peptidoglycan carboxypeptidase
MGPAVALWAVGITVHLAVVAWIYMDANRRGVSGREWAMLALCLPGISLAAYAKATGSGHAWLMLLVLGMASVMVFMAYAGHATTQVTGTQTAAARGSQGQGQGQGQINPLDPSTLPKLPDTPEGVQKLFGGK